MLKDGTRVGDDHRRLLAAFDDDIYHMRWRRGWVDDDLAYPLMAPN